SATILLVTDTVWSVISAPSPTSRSDLRIVLAAVLVGLGPGAALGVGRFAYALVLPDMLVALALGIGRAGLLGSMNTGGYLLGALVSHRILSAVGYRRGFYLAAFLQCATLLLMAVAPPFWVMSALRLAQGA